MGKNGNIDTEQDYMSQYVQMTFTIKLYRQLEKLQNLEPKLEQHGLWILDVTFKGLEPLGTNGTCKVTLNDIIRNPYLHLDS